MGVVDRDQERPGQGERANGLQCRGGDGTLVGWPIVFAADQERELERSPLRRRQGRQDEPEIRLEQVGERRVGQPNLAAAGTTSDDPEPGGAGLRDRGFPERRLADAGLSLDEQSGGQGSDVSEE